MTATEARLRHLRTEFAQGRLAASARDLRLTGLPLPEANERLIRAGFRLRVEHVRAERTPEGKPQWRCKDGGASTDPGSSELLDVHVYAHVDGSLVRIWSEGDPIGREVPAGAPYATKSALFERPFEDAIGFSANTRPTNEAFYITDDDEAVPRFRRASSGIPFDPQDLVESYRFAEEVVREGVIPLQPRDR